MKKSGCGTLAPFQNPPSGRTKQVAGNKATKKTVTVSTKPKSTTKKAVTKPTAAPAKTVSKKVKQKAKSSTSSVACKTIDVTTKTNSTTIASKQNSTQVSTSTKAIAGASATGAIKKGNAFNQVATINTKVCAASVYSESSSHCVSQSTTTRTEFTANGATNWNSLKTNNHNSVISSQTNVVASMQRSATEYSMKRTNVETFATGAVRQNSLHNINNSYKATTGSITQTSNSLLNRRLVTTKENNITSNIKEGTQYVYSNSNIKKALCNSATGSSISAVANCCKPFSPKVAFTSTYRGRISPTRSATTSASRIGMLAIKPPVITSPEKPLKTSPIKDLNFSFPEMQQALAHSSAHYSTINVEHNIYKQSSYTSSGLHAAFSEEVISTTVSYSRVEGVELKQKLSVRFDV